MNYWMLLAYASLLLMVAWIAVLLMAGRVG